MTLHDETLHEESLRLAPLPSTTEVMGLSDAALTHLLAAHGQDVATMPPAARTPSRGAEEDVEIIPLRAGWYRCAVTPDGALSLSRADHPVRPGSLDAPVTIRDPRIEDLPGWIPRRLDLDGDAQWWLRIMQHPRRESHAAVVQHTGAQEPELVVVGGYPDALLCPGPALAFVEPDPQETGRARARLVPVIDPPADGSFPVLAEGPAGAVRLLPTSVRRYLKVADGVRSERVWRLVDTAQEPPHPSELPIPAEDPDLVDVALVEDAAHAVQLTNDDHGWQMRTAPIRGGDVLPPGTLVASGPGRARGVSGGRDSALVHWAQGPKEHLGLVRLPREVPQRVRPVLSTPGTYSLQLNTCADGVGFAVPELVIGAAPRSWFLDHAGTVLNPGVEEGPRVWAVRESVTSADGTRIDLDLRWRGPEWFEGPTVLMVYGAYGIDLDLDTDPELRRWIDRGFAVATAHVRGGGGQRHQAGIRDRREASVQDAIAAAGWLRAGGGAVRATRLCVIGASAGGFLAASLVARAVPAVDAAVIVNGYVDPLASLVTDWSRTRLADLDEWGDPGDPAELAALTALSPLRRLRGPGAPTLVVVSGRDARVDPRLGLAWTLRYRQVGGHATLWYDPDGTHERWGTHLDSDTMIDWVDRAFAGSLSPRASRRGCR